MQAFIFAWTCLSLVCTPNFLPFFLIEVAELVLLWKTQNRVLLTDSSIGKENTFHSPVILVTGLMDHPNFTAWRMVLGQDFDPHVF